MGNRMTDLSVMDLEDDDLRAEVQDETEQCFLAVFKAFGITESADIKDLTFDETVELQRLITDAHWRINAVARVMRDEKKRRTSR